MGGVSGHRLTWIASGPAKFTFVYTTFRSKTPRVVTVCAYRGASSVRYATAGPTEVVIGLRRQLPDSRIYGQYTRFSSQIHTHTARNITNEIVETNISNMNSRSQLLQTGHYQVISLTIIIILFWGNISTLFVVPGTAEVTSYPIQCSVGITGWTDCVTDIVLCVRQGWWWGWRWGRQWPFASLLGSLLRS